MQERQGPTRRRSGAERPAVSVIVPLGGDREAQALAERLGSIELRDGDEILVADNRPRGLPVRGSGAIRVVRADAERSSYYARNAGAEGASNDWLLFMDADCIPDPSLLDAYFRPPPEERCGVVAGRVISAAAQTELLARWARSREHLSETHHTRMSDGAPHPAGITGNLLVRREAWESLGGFQEGIRSAGDVEFCWRAQDAGWTFEHRPTAVVEHRHLVRLRQLAAQSVRHHAGRLWLRRRYPGSVTRPRVLRPLGRCAAGVVVWVARGQFERATFKLIDAVSVCGAAWGWYVGENSVEGVSLDPGHGRTHPSVVVMTEAFPARSETFVYNEVSRLAERGRPVRVESSVRPAHVERERARALSPRYLEDDPPRRKLVDLCWLAARHPVRVVRDLRAGRRWAREEEVWPLSAIAPAARRIVRAGDRHLHAHFAAGAALNAMRLHRLLDVPFSITAHAYDLFQQPRNLREKLESASFVAGECDYTVAAMRRVVRPSFGERIHCVRTGVDAAGFRRTTPYRGGGRVVAVGRHVEKKGFPNLIRAAEHLRDHDAFEGIEIAGEGPLRDAHARLIAELGVGDFVSLRGNVWGENGVARFLESADILAIPAVPAADGDRDALPVISYEALAMEVPVVASDFVGLPEVVRPEWGRLVPPGDPEALARAIAELLDLHPDERAEMGRLGREFVIEVGNPAKSVARLDDLINGAATGERQRPQFSPRGQRGA
jgi:colanic acid/amylovoran biosynthesis glycosyltransferase